MKRTENDPINNIDTNAETEFSTESETDETLPENTESSESETEIGVSSETEDQVNYAELAKADMRELISLFPHLAGKESITELDNPLRYAALRDLGLSAKEAYLATSEPIKSYDTRSHLKSAVPRGAANPTDTLGAKELEAARELFSGLSDREIQKLYKKVSK